MTSDSPRISIDEWFDYLDDHANAATRQRIELAIATHGPSREIWESLRLSTSDLRDEARRLHQMVQLPESSIEEAHAHVMACLHSEPGTVLAPARLDQVESLLVPWCGRRVAAGLVLAAVARTSASSSGSLWSRFLEQLETLTSALCGGAAARLTVEFGRGLA